MHLFRIKAEHDSCPSISQDFLKMKEDAINVLSDILQFLYIVYVQCETMKINASKT